MNDLVMACALGTLIGIALFFVCALTGHIDKWTAYLVKRFGRQAAGEPRNIAG